MNKRKVAAATAGAVIAGVFGLTAADVVPQIGSSDASCDSSICPGDSWQAAYLALPTTGGELSVGAGSYPQQTLKQDPTKTGPVVFVAQGAVSVAGIVSGDLANATSVGIRNATFSGFALTADLVAKRGTENVIFNDITAPRFLFQSVKNVSVLGGSYGPNLTDDVPRITGCSGCPLTSGVVIDGARFHDITVTNPANHAECLHVEPANNITIRNSVFQNCTDFDIFFKSVSGIAMTGATIENNALDIPMPGNENTRLCDPACPRAGNSISISDAAGAISNVRVAYNSALGGISIGPANTSVVRKDNALTRTWFVDPNTQDGTMDLHLLTGSGAIDTGDPADFPVTDLEGTVRPIGGAPDQGAYEFGVPLPPPTTTTTTTEPTTTTTTEPTTTTTTTETTTTETTTIPPPNPREVIFCQDYVPAIQAAVYFSKWMSQNPGEFGRWTTYRDALCADGNPAAPSMTTFFGKALIDAGRMVN